MNIDEAILNKYICDAKETLKKFEEKLGWKKVLKEPTYQCPINADHLVPKTRFDSHVRRCKWRKAEYTHEEINEIIEEENSKVINPCIHTDDIVAKVAPGVPPLRTYERFHSTLTSAERLRVYELIIERLNANQKKNEKPVILVDLYAKNVDLSEDSSVKSDELTMKNMRDHKRRRPTYRAKNVHITKRSQTEIIRDVLAVHMEQLHRVWNPETSHNQPLDESRSSRDNDERVSTNENLPKRLSRERSSHEASREKRNRHSRGDSPRSYNTSHHRVSREKHEHHDEDDFYHKSRERKQHKHSQRDHESKKSSKKRKHDAERRSSSKRKKHKSDRNRDT